MWTHGKYQEMFFSKLVGFVIEQSSRVEVNFHLFLNDHAQLINSFIALFKIKV